MYENLHQSIKKPALIKIMDELTEEGHLQAKDFKKVRMYLAKQVSNLTLLLLQQQQQHRQPVDGQQQYPQRRAVRSTAM